DYRYKKDELFKRLKVTTFAQLVIQVASVSDLNDDENNEELRRLDDNSSVLSGTDAELLSERTNGKGGPEGTLQTAPVQFIDNNNDSGETELSPRSTLQSVISGVGEMDLDKTSQKNVNSTPASSPRITNKPCTDCPYLLLDVRDKDEYEQCHIIGGLKVIAQKFPEGLTTGSFPPLCQQSVPPTSGRKRSTPRPPSYPAENKWQFTSEDLNKIQFYLEDMLIPTNTNNYRYKKDELFKRLKVTTFAQLVIQVASVSDLNDDENNEELRRLDDNSSVLSGTDAELLSERTNGKGGPEGTLQTAPVQFIDNNNDSGETELSPRSTLQSVISGVGEMDLDKTSQKNVNSTPASSPRITNKPYTDCPYLLLDVRDKDEYEQCHIIGGLKVIAQKFPEGLTTGSFPPLCQQSVPPTSGRKRSAPRPPSYPAENKWQFTPEDLNKIQFYLEDILIPTNTNSRLSRLSMGSAQSKVSSTRSSYTPSVSGSDSTRTQSSTRHWK
ncbi:UNVERIFIED_CONTAM: hypothetical protein FKN15_049789, partial [Acipenser sinensis]